MIQAAPQIGVGTSFSSYVHPAAHFTHRRKGGRKAFAAGSHSSATDQAGERKAAVRLLHARAAALNQHTQHNDEQCAANNTDDPSRIHGILLSLKTPSENFSYRDRYCRVPVKTNPSTFSSSPARRSCRRPCGPSAGSPGPPATRPTRGEWLCSASPEQWPCPLERATLRAG
jgi:hypothetical protein